MKRSVLMLAFYWCLTGPAAAVVAEFNAFYECQKMKSIEVSFLDGDAESLGRVVTGMCHLEAGKLERAIINSLPSGRGAPTFSGLLASQAKVNAELIVEERLRRLKAKK